VSARLALLAVAVVAVAGCASPGYEEVYPLERLQHPHVTRTCPDEPAEHFDGDTSDIVAVYRCTAQLLPPDDHGVVKLEHWVDRAVDWDAVLAAYAAPDAQPEGACTRQLEDPLILWVARTDGTTPVYAPKDRCGFPTDAARAALESTGFERILVAKMVPEER
jgi:hypothetical protein